MKYIDRHSLLLQAVTLNGFPARITGLRDEYATIRALRGETDPIQHSWEHVDTVVRSTRAF